MPSAARPKQAFEPHVELSTHNVAQQETIRSLREMLDRKHARFVQQSEAQKIYFQGFHDLLPKGIPRGSMLSISGAASCGKTSLALSLASSITHKGGYAAIIDGTGKIFPPALCSYQAQMSHLLLVRVPRGERNPNQKGNKLFWTSNQVLRSGLFDLVVVLGLKHSSASAIRQLQLTSEQSPSYSSSFIPQSYRFQEVSSTHEWSYQSHPQILVKVL